MHPTHFRKIWTEITGKNPLPEKLPNDPTSTSPEIEAFLDEIAMSSPEDLRQLLGLPPKPEENEFPPEAQSTLKALYAKYGTYQTVEQKLYILSQVAGDIITYEDSSTDAGKKLKLAIAEHDYLVQIGILDTPI